MPLQLNLVRDFAEILRKRLLYKGYVPRTVTDEETISRYLNVLNRKIEPKIRDTKRSATLTVPPEHQAGFDALMRPNWKMISVRCSS